MSAEDISLVDTWHNVVELLDEANKMNNSIRTSNHGDLLIR